jgi:hypothetical protein
MPFKEIVDHFPSVQHAFAYGSGVFKQPGLYADDIKHHDGPMVDMIFAVHDPLTWHKEVKTSVAKAVAMLIIFLCFLFFISFLILHLTNIQNIARNGSHYASLKWLGPSAVSFEWYFFLHFNFSALMKFFCITIYYFHFRFTFSIFSCR